MIDYFEQLIPEEQEGITEVIQTLFRQTFLLERKFDRRLGRMQYTHEYRVCSKHFEFLNTQVFSCSKSNFAKRYKDTNKPSAKANFIRDRKSTRLNSSHRT